MDTIEPDASFMAAVCLCDDNCHMGNERQGESKQKIGKKKQKNMPSEAPAGCRTIAIAALIKLLPPFSHALREHLLRTPRKQCCGWF